jgi:hypothetical protein
LLGLDQALGVAIAVLITFLWWSYRATSRSFFRGVLAGTGLVLAFDIIWDTESSGCTISPTQPRMSYWSPCSSSRGSSFCGSRSPTSAGDVTSRGTACVHGMLWQSDRDRT